jgi:hypothetical protein
MITRHNILTTILFFSPLLSGCPGFQEPTQTLIITGEIQRDAFLYKVPNPQQPDPDLFIPIKRVFVGSSIELPAGNYYVATECSGYAFQHKLDNPTKIPMSKVHLARKGQGDNPDDPEEPLLLECSDPIDGSTTRWTDLANIAVFPGDTTFSLTKKKFSVSSPLDNPQTHEIVLSSILLQGGEESPKDKYFIFPADDEASKDSYVVSSTAGKRIWLPAGIFSVEVNGTRRKFEVSANSENIVLAGTLRIDVPPAFSADERAKAGGQPVFAFINEGVLFNLATDYILLPGEYDVSIEGSDVRKHVVIEPNKKAIVPTRVAMITHPPCPQGTTCRNPPRVSIHKDQRPFPLALVDTGIPFVVFDEPYEYAVDETRGLFRALNAATTTVKPESLARIKIQWNIRPATGKTRTDLVRLESRGAPNFGRTLDLLFSKPEEIFVPAGHYALTYFVGDPSVDRLKTRVDITATEGSTQTVVVPLYIESKQKVELQEAEKLKAEQSTEGKMPHTLAPVQR